ncbi:large ribosomal subunit protein uL15x-like [Coffea arabica]|uniref:Large ribosomal subunit protein uL15x-like n=1 Tax=Coffea arabica TaxID=13443 RepID=A0ABM4U7U4_COFAR
MLVLMSELLNEQIKAPGRRFCEPQQNPNRMFGWASSSAFNVSKPNYHPGYFGKVGMRYFHKLRNKFHCLIVNIDKLWSLVPQEAKDKATKDNIPLIDITQFGYFKVMGKGVLPENQPVVVKVKLVSKTAKKKIKEAGGAVVLTA